MNPIAEIILKYKEKSLESQVNRKPILSDRNNFKYLLST